MMRRPLLMVVALMLVSVQASAQDVTFFSGIFKNFHSVTIYTHASELQGASGLTGGTERCVVLDMCGGGVELLIDLDTLTGRHVELGLGASYLRGFRLRDSVLDLRASLRSFPTLSGYFTGGNVFGVPKLTGYIGMSFGLSELWNGQVYDSVGREITLKGQTFEYGGTAGVYLELGRVGGPFLEGGYKRRNFTSLDWGRDSLPSEHYPRSLDLSGWNLAVGWQFQLRQDPLPKKAPALAGTWRLVTVDGDSLPYTHTQDLVGGSQSTRTQWVDGTLVFTATSNRYDLVIRRRKETLTYADVISITQEAPLTNSGTYTEVEEAETVTLQPWLVPAPAKTPTAPVVTRVGNDLRLLYDDRLLTFTKM